MYIKLTHNALLNILIFLHKEESFLHFMAMLNKNYFKLGLLVFAATLAALTDLGFLWFREFYLESSRVIQVKKF